MTHCNYIDYNHQKSEDMNLICVENKMSGKDNYCISDYKFYDNVAENSHYLNVKRDVDAGYGVVQNTNNQQNTNYQQKKIKKDSNIEGFTGKIFITDNGPGKSFINKNECPEGFSWDPYNKICVQVCSSCKYNDNMKSQEFNEYDKCFPNGVYDGITKDGVTKCTCGENNQYCKDNFISDIFSSIGLLS